MDTNTTKAQLLSIFGVPTPKSTKLVFRRGSEQTFEWILILRKAHVEVVVPSPPPPGSQNAVFWIGFVMDTNTTKASRVESFWGTPPLRTI